MRNGPTVADDDHRRDIGPRVSRSSVEAWPRALTLVVVIGFVIVGVSGVLVGKPLGHTTPQTLGPVVRQQTFNQPDGSSLGASWTTPVGQWRVAKRAAYLAEPADEPAAETLALPVLGLALTNMPANAKTFGVTVRSSHANCGVAFGTVGAESYWALVAQPRFGTWNIQRVERGRALYARGGPLAPSNDNTPVRLTFHGQSVRIALDQTEFVFADPSLVGPHTVGMISLDRGCAAERWTNVMFTR
jgi:hypothetical protein